MNLRDFRRAGHFPSLVSAFLYFDVSFMIWVLVGALAVSISAELGLDPDKNAFEKGLMVAVPLLKMRFPWGWVVMAGEAQTFTRMAMLLAAPQVPLTRTQ